MRDAWKQLDLEGEGLQSLNLRYSRNMRRPRRAYALMLLFPFGLHRWYLKAPLGALAYPVLCALIPGLWWWQGEWMALVPALVLLLYLVWDLFWTPRRCVALNKTLRMHQFMRPGTRPPAGYRGRYVDETLEDYVQLKERERAGHPVAEPEASEDHPAAEAQPPASFNQQEAMLQELIRSHKGRRH